MRALWRASLLLVLACGDGAGPNPNNARLTVEVVGLPAGIDADIQVDGPGNYGQLVGETTTFAQLTPGAYVVTASQVTAASVTYVPAPGTQTVTLATDGEETATVTYAP
jgi:hypothetical protein